MKICVLMLVIVALLPFTANAQDKAQIQLSVKGEHNFTLFKPFVREIDKSLAEEINNLNRPALTPSLELRFAFPDDRLMLGLEYVQGRFSTEKELVYGFDPELGIPDLKDHLSRQVIIKAAGFNIYMSPLKIARYRMFIGIGGQMGHYRYKENLRMQVFEDLDQTLTVKREGPYYGGKLTILNQFRIWHFLAENEFGFKNGKMFSFGTAYEF
ncbi:MAG: hypothetical protein A2750_00200 [Candidatus Yanofskybacteria bacterium RIFCSPHIGHO2_01_FULL_45_42]|uniref:Outer membrane protein beta-barrel domain-containing protein n=3 Tax=Candidatus Yanofskyibacteriota TaxID=1752733 RepID=A0A1F8F5J7_9BACT|nr:MAG: hypothetical protein A2750_00200 [Candidatus Yanofskybacteria bacterium RIFCSPHIGHO2_01_FULL_45_42]OGN15853.1 MAG: hypothetical protein A3C81_02045 [Candidatus Yanofskybacteria bacterium RIFCSPHIGHO2_02_FULL_46_19]OGN27430.1 MAG: hypothetical protein A3B17_01500 [Candidatus Yanofskybacteria bacterium RIFCSPLOWO2_01_FULL_45_72]OGN32291.1 MAG: hypothetical protein A3J01_02410 [Candidatus Yanofskybacteria bacterium RIFCSPLOWO2_02_FULL_45_18]